MYTLASNHMRGCIQLCRFAPTPASQRQAVINEAPCKSAGFRLSGCYQSMQEQHPGLAELPDPNRSLPAQVWAALATCCDSPSSNGSKIPRRDRSVFALMLSSSETNRRLFSPVIRRLIGPESSYDVLYHLRHIRQLREDASTLGRLRCLHTLTSNAFTKPTIANDSQVQARATVVEGRQV